MKSIIPAILFIAIFANCRAQNVPPTVAWVEGVKYLQDRDYIRGVERMDEYLSLIPYSQFALYNRGIALINLGDIDGGCRDLKMAWDLGYRKHRKFRQYSCEPEYKLKYLKKQFYKNVDLIPEEGYRPRYTRKDTLRGQLRPERTCFDVYFYDLSVRIIPKRKRIQGTNHIYFHVKEESKRIQLDLFENMQLDSILWLGQALSYSREFDAVWVDFPKKLEPGNSEKIEVYYQGKPHIASDPPWDGGFVWKRDNKRNRWVGVACEQLGASVWWPNKDHLSDRPDSMGIHIEVPETYQGICNGTLRSSEPTDNGYERFNWFVHYPINNYNVTFYMGKYVEFTDTVITDGQKLVCRYHVLPQNLEKAREHFSQAGEVVDYYNQAFGFFPFPKDNFRMVESPYSGMEHQTAIAYGNAYGNVKEEGYLNNPYDYIIVHEAAHEWWGNTLTVGDMADAWLHEGFATYAEYLFLEHVFDYQEAITELHHNMMFIFNFWPMVQNRDVNEDSFASNDIYTKGAMLLHCLRSVINNDSLFFNLIRDFNTQHRNRILITDHFIDFVNNYTGDNYTDFFSKYLYDVRLPVLSYNYKRDGKDIILKCKWTEVGQEFKMPFAVEYGNQQSIRIEATTEAREVRLKDAGTFMFYNMHHHLAGLPRHGLTYYWTRKEEF